MSPEDASAIVEAIVRARDVAALRLGDEHPIPAVLGLVLADATALAFDLHDEEQPE